MIEKGGLRRPAAPRPANRGDEQPRRRAGGPAAAFGAPLQADIPPGISPGISPDIPVASSGGDPASGLGPLHNFSRL